jgi:hypothetical protein
MQIASSFERGPVSATVPASAAPKNRASARRRGEEDLLDILLRRIHRLLNPTRSSR